MSCPLRIAYSPIICSALPIQSEFHFHYVDPQSPEKQRVDPQLPEKALAQVFPKNPVAKTWQRRGEGKDRSFAIVFAKSVSIPTKIAPELESERPRRPTLAGKDVFFFIFFPMWISPGSPETSHENLTKIRLYTHDFDE